MADKGFRRPSAGASASLIEEADDGSIEISFASHLGERGHPQSQSSDIFNGLPGAIRSRRHDVVP
jgi:hypothetical protein